MTDDGDGILWILSDGNCFDVSFTVDIVECAFFWFICDSECDEGDGLEVDDDVELYGNLFNDIDIYRCFLMRVKFIDQFKREIDSAGMLGWDG